MRLGWQAHERRGARTSTHTRRRRTPISFFCVFTLDSRLRFGAFSLKNGRHTRPPSSPSLACACCAHWRVLRGKEAGGRKAGGVFFGIFARGIPIPPSFLEFFAGATHPAGFCVWRHQSHTCDSCLMKTNHSFHTAFPGHRQNRRRRRRRPPAAALVPRSLALVRPPHTSPPPPWPPLPTTHLRRHPTPPPTWSRPWPPPTKPTCGATGATWMRRGRTNWWPS